MQLGLLTIDQLAEKLQVRKSWVYEKTRSRFADANPIPFYKIGKHYRFSNDEIDQWLLNSRDGSLKFQGKKKVSHRKGD